METSTSHTEINKSQNLKEFFFNNIQETNRYDPIKTESSEQQFHNYPSKNIISSKNITEKKV